ncbi:MAG: NADH-quinone oxidoreductase subunit M [Candidatus Binatia bacterium]|jgi:NADH-quinone oxidoreductase subunit M
MLELHFPWLELTVALPLLGAALIARLRNPIKAWRRAALCAGLTLICALGAWEDFQLLHVFEAHDHWDVVTPLIGSESMVIDELSAPLIPLAALLYFAVILATPRTKVRRFPIAGSLFSQGLLQALLICREPWGIVVLLAALGLPPVLDMRRRGRSPRVFLFHHGLFVVMLAVGWALVDGRAAGEDPSGVGMILLVAAILIRCGSFPLHCWMPDLFENTSFGTALLHVAPMTGAYAAARLALPVVSDGALRIMGLLALFTAVYAAGMALVQTEARRFFCFLFLSFSSLALVGLELASPLGLTGGLYVWGSVGVSMVGLGLALRSIESRTGRLSLGAYHGLYRHMPLLAIFFLLAGLGSIGFPGTIGFVGAELVIEGAIGAFPYVGILVVIAGALNGIAILHAYFRLFTGAEHTASISLAPLVPERAVIWLFSALIVGFGLWPQPAASSRHHAAMEIIARRAANQDAAAKVLHPSSEDH